MELTRRVKLSIASSTKTNKSYHTVKPTIHQNKTKSYVVKHGHAEEINLETTRFDVNFSLYFIENIATYWVALLFKDFNAPISSIILSVILFQKMPLGLDKQVFGNLMFWSFEAISHRISRVGVATISTGRS